MRLVFIRIRIIRKHRMILFRANGRHRAVFQLALLNFLDIKIGYFYSNVQRTVSIALLGLDGGVSTKRRNEITVPRAFVLYIASNASWFRDNCNACLLSTSHYRIVPDVSRSFRFI